MLAVIARIAALWNASYNAGMGWIEALLADISLAVAYVIYAFFFNIGYDRVFPIEPVA